MIDPPKNRLAEAMANAGKTRSEVASLINRTEDTVRRLEENRGGPIPSQFIPALATFLNCEPEHLMGWDRLPAGSGKAA